MNDAGAGGVKWGILAAGGIAATFAKGLAASRTGRLVAVGSRSRETAERFGEAHNVPRRHGSYEALLEDAEVDAVYIATPHPMHVEWAVRAAEAKKHILCEKPIGLNAAEAAVIIDAARANGVFLMEAFMYRCHPQAAKIARLVRDKVLGEVRAVSATFSFRGPRPADPNGRLLNKALGGGGILDVGCYPVSMSRLIAGAALGRQAPAEPVAVIGMGHLGVTGVDEWTTGVLRFENDLLAQVAAGVEVWQENAVRIYGSEGMLHVPSPWIQGERVSLFLSREGEADPQEIVVESERSPYALEADLVAECVAAGRQQPPYPAMTWDDTLGNMRALDLWRQAVGLEYEAERRGRSPGPSRPAGQPPSA